ncbi:aminotransferase class V-fold PLP-dependent enzyme [Catenulispora yoronensis]|uniref:Kynureninase n=1 Tax=Catenulispora yoronensis TaxID=450799 RepID=A0ABN2V335_9ACTN
MPNNPLIPRSEAERRDTTDPLAALRSEFVIPDDSLIYLDGNSLGRLSKASLARVEEVVAGEWGNRLIRSWNERWQTLPQVVGDFLGEQFLGAAPGQVVVSDSTSVNLYKLASAALDARPGRNVIISDLHNFPTDRYVLEGLAAARGLELKLVEFDELLGPTADQLRAVVDERTALVSPSQVDYRSAALADLGAVNQVVHEAGALVLWDLCHSVGAVPIELDATGTDLAVGCTYKYLNGGPGSPAFLYVSQSLIEGLRQPIWGWYGQRDQFAMGQGYDPVPSATRFLVGTPQVVGVSLVDAGAHVLAAAGIKPLRDKGVALTEFAIELFDAWLAPLGFTLGSPRDAAVRGNHVSVRHQEAYRICRALIERYDVIPDFRIPDRVRLGMAPATTRFVDVWDAFDAMRRIVEAREYEAVDPTRTDVT